MSKEFKERLNNEPVTIGILGAIGSGKSTLSAILAQELGVEKVEENFGQNPFLKDFYEDKKRFSFDSQFWFLTSTVLQLRDVDNNKSLVLDPSNSMNYIYARTHTDMGWMSEDELDLYRNAYLLFEELDAVQKPDLQICLDTDIKTLTDRIAKRGRSYETSLLSGEGLAYLSKLNYNVSVFSGPNVLHIDASNDNFTDSNHVGNLIQKIKEELK